MAATLAMEPAAKIEAGCGEEEAQHLLSREEATAGSMSRRMFAARPLATAALLLCGAIAALVLTSMPGGFSGAATAKPKPSRPLAWFQRLSEVSDCDIAKLAGTGCMKPSLDVNVTRMCEERCMDGWRKMKGACQGEDLEAATVLLKGCKAEKAETGEPKQPKDITEQLDEFLEGLGDLATDGGLPGEKNGTEEKLLDDMFGNGTIECAIASLGIMTECGLENLGTTAQCTVNCMEALSKSEGCQHFDKGFSESVQVLRSACGGCGRAMMEINAKGAETCDLDIVTEDGKDWKPCATKCHPLACTVAKECVPGIKDPVPGMTDADLIKFQAKVTEDMKECPCDA